MGEKTNKITVLAKNKQFIIECNDNETLLSAMIRQGLYYSFDCGGRGTCGKCKIRILNGWLDITSQDEKLLTLEQIQLGIRLSCKAYPHQECTVELLMQDETDISVVAEYQIKSKPTLIKDIKQDSEHRIENKQDLDLPMEQKGFNKPYLDKWESESKETEHQYGVAIDLGTTTLAFSLVDINEKKVLKTHTAINRQRVYGADVISRIKASNEGKRDNLRDIILQQLHEGIHALLFGEAISLKNLNRIIISGNTTMGHLLLGYSCETLGVFPFEPVNVQTITISYKELFAENYEVPIILLPGISAFVGGDIVSGLLACNFDRTEAPCLLIDLGTNGEMAIGNKDKVLVASTAAGPAFEGGNISCGVGSIPGAINQISIKNGETIYETIQGLPPIGICGTGVIELVSELLNTGYMDDTGLLIEPYFDEGFPIADFSLHQKDIRELQLAKAAIRAGIEILTSRYGINYNQIDKVYLAGGFGYYIDITKAIHIGLLPKELEGKIVAVGNSSLAGAVSSLTDLNAIERMENLVAISKEIHLSNDALFYDLYINAMSF